MADLSCANAFFRSERQSKSCSTECCLRSGRQGSSAVVENPSSARRASPASSPIRHHGHDDDDQQQHFQARSGSAEQRRRTFDAQRETYLVKRAAAQRLKEQEAGRVAAARETLEAERETKRRELARARRSSLSRGLAAVGLTVEASEARAFVAEQRLAKAAEVKAGLLALVAQRQLHEEAAVARAQAASFDVMRTRRRVARTRAFVHEVKSREASELRAQKERRRRESTAVVVAMAAASKAVVHQSYSRRFFPDDASADRLINTEFGLYLCRGASAVTAVAAGAVSSGRAVVLDARAARAAPAAKYGAAQPPPAYYGTEVIENDLLTKFTAQATCQTGGTLNSTAREVECAVTEHAVSESQLPQPPPEPLGMSSTPRAVCATASIASEPGETTAHPLLMC